MFSFKKNNNDEKKHVLKKYEILSFKKWTIDIFSIFSKLNYAKKYKYLQLLFI